MEVVDKADFLVNLYYISINQDSFFQINPTEMFKSLDINDFFNLHFNKLAFLYWFVVYR